MTDKEKKQAIILGILILVLIVSVLVMQLRLKAQKERFNENSQTVTQDSGSSVYVPSGSSALATSGASIQPSGSSVQTDLKNQPNNTNAISVKVSNTESDSEDDSGSSASSGASMTSASVQAFYKNRQTLVLTTNANLFQMTPKVNKESSEMESVQAQASDNMIQNGINDAIAQIKYSGYYQSGENMVFMLMYNNQNYTYTNSGQLSVSVNGANYALNLSLTPDNDLLLTNSTYNIAQTKSM